MRRNRWKRKLAAVQQPATRRAEGKVRYYWAYGSNLCIDQMWVRCPEATAVGPLYLDNGALIFRGYADVVGRKDSRVAGGLWKVTEDCIAALDRYEGVRSFFYEKLYLTLLIKGKEEECLFYKMRNPKGILPPWDEYLETVVQGYEDFGLERELLDKALQHAWSGKRKTPDVKSRWARAGKPKLSRTIIIPDREEIVEGA